MSNETSTIEQHDGFYVQTLKENGKVSGIYAAPNICPPFVPFQKEKNRSERPPPAANPWGIS